MADQFEDLSREQLLKLVRQRERQKKLGLVWERDAIERDRALDDRFISLSLVSELGDGAAPWPNMVIEGDNFDALRWLRMTMAGKFRCILIDPPYNTGNKDWVYNDHYVDKEDAWRHSTWLEFLYQRLMIARDLLARDGVLLITISDEQRSKLEMLMDEVLPGMRVGSLVWRTRVGSNADQLAFLSPDHEHVLVYAGPDFRFAGNEKTFDMYGNPDNDPNGDWTAGDLTLSADPADLRPCNVFVVTVPTPVTATKQPDLSPLLAACRTVGRVLEPGNVVVYESTVYPGATEEECVPLLEEHSGLLFNRDFYCGYSPERINPGDKTHRLAGIVKVTSGSTPRTADFVDALYASIIPAGTHKASSIRVAEAAKVIENTQRDLNIGLINELAMIFNRLGIETAEVLAAAGSKWNFLPFRPGLVGGHCIGVDPYYLTHKAQQVGYHPDLILAARRVNDNMGAYVAGRLVKAMLRKRIHIQGARVLVLGLTFKENCPDIRNTRVVDIVRELADFGVGVDVHDPQVDPDEALREYGLKLVAAPEPGRYDAVVLAVAHDAFRDTGPEAVHAWGAPLHVLYDIKNLFPPDQSDLRL